MNRYLTEFTGTFFLVFTIGCSVLVGTPMAPLAIGASLMVMVYMGGHISGAHYNPAVSLGLVLRGSFAASEYGAYVAAQLLGAIAASLAVFAVTGRTFVPAPAATASTARRTARRDSLHDGARARRDERGDRACHGWKFVLRPRDRVHGCRRRVCRWSDFGRRLQPGGRTRSRARSRHHQPRHRSRTSGCTSSAPASAPRSPRRSSRCSTRSRRRARDRSTAQGHPERQSETKRVALDHRWILRHRRSVCRGVRRRRVRRRASPRGGKSGCAPCRRGFSERYGVARRRDRRGPRRSRTRPARLCAELEARGLKIDVLVNNAGYGVPGSYVASSWDVHARFLQIMVTAVAELTYRLLPGMIERRYGRIINVASLAGLVPAPAGHTLYAAAKAFLIKFSESLAPRSAASRRACHRGLSRVHLQRVPRRDGDTRRRSTGCRVSCGCRRRGCRAAGIRGGDGRRTDCRYGSSERGDRDAGSDPAAASRRRRWPPHRTFSTARA